MRSSRVISRTGPPSAPEVIERTLIGLPVSEAVLATGGLPPALPAAAAAPAPPEAPAGAPALVAWVAPVTGHTTARGSEALEASAMVLV